ncbi:MAG: carbonic anhydrase family protein, partial [Zetaproteobacteria bacterium]
AGGHGHGKGHAHWSYEGATGPLHWGAFSEMCAAGKQQSPVNIETAKVKKTKLPPLELRWKAGLSGTIVNNGHTIKVNTPGGGELVWNGKRFALVQFHFHSPSEMHVDGRAFPMVAHFVHKAEDGQLAVVALMFEEGAENAELAKVWAKMPAQVGGEARYAGLNPAALLPKDLGYYHFRGSLTTPPCSEGVEWFVLKTPASFSPAQWKAFRKLYFGNVRPTQPLNGREIEG